jgi:hypothetical protein
VDWGGLAPKWVQVPRLTAHISNKTVAKLSQVSLMSPELGRYTALFNSSLSIGLLPYLNLGRALCKAKKAVPTSNEQGTAYAEEVEQKKRNTSNLR